MIYIDNIRADAEKLKSAYPENSVERAIIDILDKSEAIYKYNSEDELKFELKLRHEIINAANALNKSDLAFRVFTKTKCNEDFWRRDGDGGFSLRDGVRPSDAIRDIFRNSSKYGTECATAMMIIYYKALLETWPEDTFNRTFRSIRLMNWHDIDRNLREAGYSERQEDYLPGDRRYFKNPDVDPETPEWQGENVIDMGDGTYYGHGIGKYRAERIIAELNQNRIFGADRSAYLMDSAGRPDFKHLYNIYREAMAEAPPLPQSA